MSATNQIIVLATRWAQGWELTISDHEHSQVRRLPDARQQVVDFLDTAYPDVDHSDWEIAIISTESGIHQPSDEAKWA